MHTYTFSVPEDKEGSRNGVTQPEKKNLQPFQMMKSKRVSALSVFRNHKQDQNEDPGEEPTAVKRSISDVGPSLMAINKKKNSNFLKAFKTGTLRNHNVSDSKKSRQSILADSIMDSPCLTAVKPVAVETPENSQVTTPSKKKKKKKSPSGNSKMSVAEMKKSFEKKIKQQQQNVRRVPQAIGQSIITTVPYIHDSRAEATKLFTQLIHPVTVEKFFTQMWERKPLVVRRHISDYYNGWFSTEELDSILRKENIQFGKNIDVTTYCDGKRETHNPTGQAHAAVVWDYFQNGCSVRLLNPQTYSENVWKKLSILQEYFGCFVGANVYLTPANSQGFAPHYDDIEAFVIQLEGKKNWTLYPYRNDSEMLARTSSGNLNVADLDKPLINVQLHAGDLLYFPRGMIHQATTVEDTHSLHITVSCCQKNTWGDFLEKMLPTAIKLAMDDDVEFRKSLPLNYLNFMGVANSESHTKERQDFMQHIDKLMRRLISHAPVDATCDQMGKKFMHESLPPYISDGEKQYTIHEQGERWNGKSQSVVSRVELGPDTRIKLLRAGIIRLVIEGDEVRIYYNLENNRLYQDVESNYLEIPHRYALAVEFLLQTYPDFTTVENLPLTQLTEQIELVQAMYEKGILLTEIPLEPLDEDSSMDEGE
ncbi:ribosomal oxygenase 1 isoform X2 [Octopus sinensis]|uniref:Bifunctional lysine-specific demethylase and histidyl-hydroxylase n=1 Tax=Octopus sinensis TaxID=2607531 RepID=A0A7E6F6R0_9MOLL|nr:ribosomal oxygenase 1 isoform X2 [Octopus sinensis]